MKGNMLTPTVATTPKTEMPLAISASPVAAQGEGDCRQGGAEEAQAGCRHQSKGMAP